MISKRFVPDYQFENGWDPTGWRRTPNRRERGIEGSKRARSTSRRRNNQNDLSKKNDEGKKNRSLKWFGLALSISSSASIAVGVSNISITDNAVFTSPGDNGCFANSAFYDQLGPKNDAMKALNWTWVSVGLWSAFFTYLAGLVVGKITKDSSSLKKFFMFAALVSLIAFLPARLILSVLDVLLSSKCQESNTPKFALPIALIAVAVIEFTLLVIVFIRLRKQVKTWENTKIEKTISPVFKASRPVESFNQPQAFNSPPQAFFSQPQAFFSQPQTFFSPSRPAPMFQPVKTRPMAMSSMQPMGLRHLQPLTTRWAPRRQAFFTPSLYQF